MRSIFMRAALKLCVSSSVVALGGIAIGAYAPALLAQTTSAPIPTKSGEIVQPISKTTSANLSDALAEVARSPKNADAHIKAGNAALELGDVEAAQGYFANARTISPNNPMALLGVGRALVQSMKPYQALALFDEADKAGAPPGLIAEERAIAYDLLGDQKAAQAAYELALAKKEQDEVRRRYALSFAISGDADGFEEALDPLTERGDAPSNRTRAFGLAILGETESAVAIAHAVMPTELAAQMEPYLRYMQKLTPAQKAAAANFGIFPRAAQIGRDSDEVAQYAARALAVSDGASRLQPKGAPLGKADSKAEVAASSAPVAAPASAPMAVNAPMVSKAPLLAPSPEKPATTTTVQMPAPSPIPIPAPTPATDPAPTPAAKAEAVIAPAEVLTRAPAAATPPVKAPEVPANFDLGKLPSAPSSSAITPAAVAPSAVEEAKIAAGKAEEQTAENSQNEAAPTEKPFTSIEEAFGEFAVPAAPASAAEIGGVDISKIAPPIEDVKAIEEAKAREEAAKKEAAKKEALKKEQALKDKALKDKAKKEQALKDASPSRIWAQVATGKGDAALLADWRKIAKKSPKKFGKYPPHSAPYGRATRLLAGPFATKAEANKFLEALKEEGVSGVLFVSDKGQEIKELK